MEKTPDPDALAQKLFVMFMTGSVLFCLFVWVMGGF